MPMNLDITRLCKGRAGRFAVLTAVAGVIMLAAAGLALASEDLPPANEMDWIMKSVHSLILFIALVVIYKKFVSGALKKRTENIENQLAEAKAAKEEAVKKLSEIEARLKDKDAEAKAVIDIATQNGEKEKERLIAEGERMSKDIVESAKENIGAELAKAKEEIRREAALMAIELAEKMVKENINREDQARILEDYIAKVGG